MIALGSRVPVWLMALMATALCWPLLATGQVYRSVDDQGRVTYSQVPPANAAEVEPLDVLPGPSEAARQAAEQRASQLIQESQERQAARARAAEDRAKAAAEAQQALEAARQALREAETPRDEDWQPLRGGGRVLRETHFNRVEEARAKVQQAETDLGQTRAGP